MVRRLSGMALAMLLLAGRLLPAAVLAAAWMTAPAWAQEGRTAVMGVRSAFHDGITRLVLDLSAPIAFTVSGDGLQIAVDLPDMEWHGASGLAKSVGVLKDFRYRPSGGGGGQLLLDTRVPSTVQKAFLLPPGASPHYRLVIDLVSGRPMPPPLAAASIPAPPPPPSRPSPLAGTPFAAPAATVAADPPPPKPVIPATAEKPVIPAVAEGGGRRNESSGLKPIPASLPVDPNPEDLPERRQSHTGKPIVVVDPGHGGPDPGATSRTGVYEKTLVLALAREVKEHLDKSGKVKCVLTRDRDFFIPLRERVSRARSAHADLFMSLHADTVADPAIRGLSVYTLSQNASDAEAQALADKENKSDIVAGIDLSNESPEVTNILIDLVQRESMNLSAVFAGRVIAQVQHETHTLLENTHRFAGFAVLKAPDIPSVLVETGYLSNERDERMLRQPEYRAKLAGALARAIEQYFARTQKVRRP